MPEFRKCQPESPEEGKATKGRITHFREIERGTERNEARGKIFADIVVERKEKERGPYPFVSKKFPTKEEALQELQKALDLKAAGIPVPETIRYAEVDGTHRLLYSDLTEGGLREVWSQSDPMVELIYLGLTEKDTETIKETTTEIAQKAATADYIISRDSYFLKRRQDGTVEVIVADLGVGVRHQAQSSQTKNLSVTNQVYADGFINRIDSLPKERDTLLNARDEHFYHRLLPLADGVRMIVEELGKGGHSHEEIIAALEKSYLADGRAAVGEDAQDLLTRPLETNKLAKELCLERIEAINLDLAAKIRSGDLSLDDLKKAATLYHHAKEVNEMLQRRTKESS